MNVTLTIPDEKIQDVLMAFQMCSDADIQVHVNKHQDPESGLPDFNTHTDFRIASQQAGENLAGYGKRFIKTYLLELIKAVDFEIRKKARQEAQAAIPIANTTLTDDIIS